MTIKLEVGQMVELNNGERHAVARMVAALCIKRTLAELKGQDND